MSDPALIEAAARALFASEMPGSDWEVFPGLHDKYRSNARTIERLAETILTAATPLIRAAALEEAARIFEADSRHLFDGQGIAAAIRALAGRPADPT
jgi:hypothetical protein